VGPLLPRIALLALIYMLTAKAGLSFAYVGSNISPIWPPTGVAMAALVLGGVRLWPGVFLGALLANSVLSPLAWPTALLISVGNTLEAVLAAALLGPVFRFHPSFEHTRDNLAWTLVAGGLCPAVGATIGVGASTLLGGIPSASFSSAWWTWWSGDSLGAIALAPALLVWSSQPWRTWDLEASHRSLLIFASLLALGLLAFFTPATAHASLSPLAFATLPPVAWAAFRFGAPGATSAALLLVVLAVWGTLSGRGAYSGFQDLNTKMGLLQGFLAVVSISALTFAGLVNERRKAEEERRQSERRFRLLMEGVQDSAILTLDPEGRILSWNEGAQRIYGYGGEEVLGRHFSMLFPETEKGAAALHLENAAQSGSFAAEGLRLRKDGSRFLAEVQISALRLADGRLEGFAKITRDITERQELLDRLKAHQQHLEQLVQNRTRQLSRSQRMLYLIYDSVLEPLALLTVEEDGEFTVASCNKAIALHRGNHPRQLVGRRLRELLDPEVAAKVFPALHAAAASGKVERAQWTLRTLVGERTFDTQIRPILEETGACTSLIVSAQDITERLHTEASVRERQKLESLGVLAGGIAHEFNNLLTGILGNANLGTLALPSKSPALPFFEKIEVSVLRAADLTSQMLAYAGRGQFDVGELDLNILVRETAQLISASISKKATLHFNLAKRLPFTRGDATQVQQMLMNLVMNASEALAADSIGLITLRTRIEELGKAECRDLHPALPISTGSYVVLEVSDTGKGMSEELQSRVLDPFYTTKAMGRGLGLPASIGILRTLQGGFRIHSEVGRGSTITLYLPALAQVNGVPRPAEQSSEWQGEGTLLLVDDEATLRDVVGRMARDLGFTVIEAQDGLQALELFQANHPRLTLVFMDLSMPRLGGREAFLEMRRLDPSIPVILSSGFSEEEVTDLFADHGLEGFLRKPYRIAEFKHKVRGVLAKGASHRTPIR
jgi:PAS domain S-box-containing protein